MVVCGDHVRVGDSCESGGGGDFGPSAMDFGQSPRMVKVILRCPLLGWVTVDSATFEARSDSPQEGLRRDDGHKTGGEPRRSVEHGSPVETVSGGMWSNRMAPGKQKCSRKLVGGKMTRPGENESFENSAKAEVGETMPGVDDRSCLNRLSGQRLRQSTQSRPCEAAPSRGQLKPTHVIVCTRHRKSARPRRHAAN